MQVTPSGGQICNQFKWWYNGPSNYKIIQVLRLNTLGPLCLWQCFSKSDPYLFPLFENPTDYLEMLLTICMYYFISQCKISLSYSASLS